MVRFKGLRLTVLLVGAVIALPAAAQSGSASSSLTHVVSVTVGPRVKVQVSALSMAPRNVPAAVKVAADQGKTIGLALTVHANEAWVLAIKSASPSETSNRPRLQWSNGASGRFTAISAADSSLASGTGSAAPLDTTVVFRGFPTPTAEQGVVLTVTAP